MDKKEKEHICIHDGDRLCEKYRYRLEILKIVLTPRMILTVGFIFITILSIIQGG